MKSPASLRPPARSLALVGAFLCLLAPGNATRTQAQEGDALRTGFASPPTSAAPQTWWHWVNGNITREGITADLESMKRVGLSGVTIVNVSAGVPPGPVKFMSAPWREAVQYAEKEGARLGLEVGIENCAGWSSSGGPWITLELAMQKVVTSETHCQGASHFSETLPLPLINLGVLSGHRRFGVSHPGRRVGEGG